MKADGTQPRELPGGALNAGFPSWSPNGKQLVYRVRSKEETGLRILEVQSGNSFPLTSGDDNFPQWSPTGEKIAFTRKVDDGGDYDIFAIAPETKVLQRLTNAPGNDAHAGWSPDGKQLLFTSSRLGYRDESALIDGIPQPYGEVFVMNADGSNPRQISDDKWEEGTPAWVPTHGDALRRSRIQ